MPMNRDPLHLISIRECAKRLSVSTKTIDRRLASGELRAHRVGGRVLIAESEVERFVLSRPYQRRCLSL